ERLGARSRGINVARQPDFLGQAVSILDFGPPDLPPGIPPVTAASQQVLDLEVGSYRADEPAGAGRPVEQSRQSCATILKAVAQQLDNRVNISACSVALVIPACLTQQIPQTASVEALSTPVDL